MTKARISFLLMALSLAGFASVSTSAAEVTTHAASNRGTSMQARNKAVIESMLRSWMNGDSSVFQAHLSDDIEWTIPGNSAIAGTTHGRQELMTKILAPFGARFVKSTDSFKPRAIDGIYADGDTVVAQFVGSGTTNNGRPYRNNYLWVLAMQDGKIVRATAFFDSVAFNELWQQSPAQQ